MSYFETSVNLVTNRKKLMSIILSLVLINIIEKQNI